MPYEKTLIGGLIIAITSLIGKVVYDAIITSKKEGNQLLAQEYKNENFLKEIAELKEGLKEYRNKHDAMAEDRNLTKHLLLDGINGLKAEFGLFAQDMKNMLSNHDKRIGNLEKKVFD